MTLQGARATITTNILNIGTLTGKLFNN